MTYAEFNVWLHADLARAARVREEFPRIITCSHGLDDEEVMDAIALLFEDDDE